MGSCHLGNCTFWEVVTCEIAHYGKLPLGKLHILGSCHLGIAHYGKLPLGKLHIMGSCHLGKYSTTILIQCVCTLRSDIFVNIFNLKLTTVFSWIHPLNFMFFKLNLKQFWLLWKMNQKYLCFKDSEFDSLFTYK